MKKAILMIVLLMFGVSISVDAQKRKSKVRRKRPAAVAHRAPVVAPPPQNFSEAIAIGVGRLWIKPISLDSTCIVSGRFEAQGGTSNAVEFYIVDQDNLTNLSNRNSFNVFYQSGVKTVDSFSIRLAPRTYYLVFSNRMAIISSKAVSFNYTITPILTTLELDN